MKQSAELLDTKAAMQIRYLEMVEELGKRGVVLMMGIGVDKKGFWFFCLIRNFLLNIVILITWMIRINEMKNLHRYTQEINIKNGKEISPA